jgi:hypothetical protein
VRIRAAAPGVVTTVVHGNRRDRNSARPTAHLVEDRFHQSTQLSVIPLVRLQRRVKHGHANAVKFSAVTES